MGSISRAGGSSADCKLSLTTVRPNLLSTPEMLSNWTDSCIPCRHLAQASVLVVYSHSTALNTEMVFIITKWMDYNRIFVIK